MTSTLPTIKDELVRIIDLYSCELGWINDNQFCVWVHWLNVYDFLNDMRETFGLGIFDDGGTDANIQDGLICFDMTDFIGSFLNIEGVYSKCDYQHLGNG